MEGAFQSVWNATATPRRYPELQGDERADVVVIGAGITGLTTALLLRRKGVDVVVVEGLRLGAGVTGRTTAKVTSQHGLLYADLLDKRGRDVAVVYARSNQAAIEKIASLVDEGGIDCAFERRSAFVYTTGEKRLAAVEREVQVAGTLGLPATFTTETDLPFEVRGAVRFDGQAQFQPVAYLDGLARMLTDAGGRIFEDSMVTAVRGSPPVVRTAGGRITSDAVVMATHLPFLDRGLYFARVEPSASHALAAESDGDLPQGMYISADSPTRSVRSFRHDGRGYIIVAGESHRTGAGGDETVHHEALAAFTREHWPGSRVTHHWMAQDYIPPDRIPYIGRFLPYGPPLYVATGFQKWGLTNGTVAAMILAETITGADHAWAPTFDARRLPSPGSLASHVVHNAKAGMHLVGDRFGGRPASAIRDLQPGQGAVVRDGARHIAVSRGADGGLTAVSAVCRHVGCLVAFNEAERTWDCPCHGSRYNADGSVLHGPTTQPLPPVDLPPEHAPPEETPPEETRKADPTPS